MSYAAQARASHRKERETVIDPPQEFLGEDYILYLAVRSAIRTANIHGVSKKRIAEVVSRTLCDMAFSAQVKP